jgi:DUF1680 family protein
MKKLKVFIPIYIFCCLLTHISAQSVSEISLLSGWVFQKGDNQQWKDPLLDDSQWINIKPSSYWDYLPDLADYDGYGWYRMKVFIPSALKADADSGDSLHIRLGRCDDNDQTFLNGVLIGENSRNSSGEGNPEFAGELGSYAKFRDYTLPLDHQAIKWDAINVIAVRAYDFYLTGGLTTYDHRMYVKKGWTDYASLRRETTYLSRLEIGKPFQMEFAAANKSPNVDYQILFFSEIRFKESNKSVATFQKELNLKAKTSEKIKLEFIPFIKTDYEITYRITNRATGQTIMFTDLLGMFSPAVELLNEIIKPIIEDKIKVTYEPINFSEIDVYGLLAEKMDLNLEKGLCNVPFALVDPYLNHFEPPWPVGEFLGKLMHGQTKGLQYYRDGQLLEITTSIIDTWIKYQKEDGYLGTNPPEERWKGWDVWDHKYLILAFVHYYAVTGYQPALDAAVKIGDLVVKSFGYGDGQLDLMDGYHMGMAPGSILEPMVYLYKYTADKKYLDFCQYIIKAYEQDNGPKIISELTEGSKTVLKVGNGKAYEMTSCIIGLIQLYKITAEKRLINAALNAWKDIHDNRLYITGTTSAHEHFQKTGDLPAGINDDMGESCVTAHWMYLNKELFKLYGDEKYIDEIEKSLYNHLLATQHPISGNIVYYAGLQNKKWYMEPDLYIGPPLCCHMSVKRCIAEIPEFTYYKAAQEIGILLYNPSRVRTELKSTDSNPLPVEIVVQSNYPLSDEISIKVNPEIKEQFTLALRVPDWCESYLVKIDQDKIVGEPGHFMKLNREWKKDQEINIKMNSTLILLSGGKSYPDHYALRYGNQVLAVDADVNQLKNLEDVVFYSNIEPNIETYSGELPDNWVGKQAFVSNVIKTKGSRKVILVPYADASQTGGNIKVWIKQK